MKNVFWGIALTACTAAACSSPNGSNPGGAGASGNNQGPLCEQQYDAIVAHGCGMERDRSANVQSCQYDQHDYEGIGCDDEYGGWLECTTRSRYDCQADTGCENAQNAYFACQSQAVVRTGCVRLGTHDATDCSTDASKPYAFSCTGAAPAQCVKVVSEGAGIWCCPQL